MARKAKRDQQHPTRALLTGSLLIALCLFWIIVDIPSIWVERVYSRGIYPVLSGILVSLTGHMPFSLATVLLITLPLLWLVISIRSYLKHKSLWWWPWWLWHTLLSLALLYCLFILFWGANYRRETVETLFGLSERTVSQQDLIQLANRLQTIIETTSESPRDATTAIISIKERMQDIHQNVFGHALNLPPVKRLPPGWLILSGRASGVISPWTLEAHVDGALPEVAYLATAAHELAHIAGFAGEADADFVSAIAGLKAKDAYARYAVALRLWWDAVSLLPAEKRQNYLASLPSIARADLEQSFEPYRRYQLPAWVQNLQRRSYDQYLKSQGVKAGISDYSRIVSLLIWYFDKNQT